MIKKETPEEHAIRLAAEGRARNEKFEAARRERARKIAMIRIAK